MPARHASIIRRTLRLRMEWPSRGWGPFKVRLYPLHGDEVLEANHWLDCVREIGSALREVTRPLEMDTAEFFRVRWASWKRR